MICSHCGKEIPDAAQNCAFCGNSTATVSPQPAVQSTSLLSEVLQSIRRHLTTLALLESIVVLVGLVFIFASPATSPLSVVSPFGLGASSTLFTSVGVGFIVYGIIRLTVWSGQVYVISKTPAETSFLEAWVHGWKRFLPVLGYVVLLFFVYAPLVIVPALTLLVGFGAFGGSGVLPSAAAPLLVLVILPLYIFLSVRLLFALPLAALGEGEGNKLKVSWTLTKGRFGYTFKAFAIMMAVSFGIQMVVQLFGFILPYVIGFIVPLLGQAIIEVFVVTYLVVLLRRLQNMPTPNAN